MPDATNGADQLRGAGLRVTSSRLAVLTVLTEHPHATAEAVARRPRDRLGPLPTQAVYDVLEAFTRAGLGAADRTRRFPALFETRAGDNHPTWTAPSARAPA